MERRIRRFDQIGQTRSCAGGQRANNELTDIEDLSRAFPPSIQLEDCVDHGTRGRADGEVNNESRHKSGTNAKVTFHILNHRANRTHGGSQLIRCNAELLAPIAELVILVNVDPGIICPAGLFQVICHVSGSNLPLLSRTLRLHAKAFKSAATS